MLSRPSCSSPSSATGSSSSWARAAWAAAGRARTISSPRTVSLPVSPSRRASGGSIVAYRVGKEGIFAGVPLSPDELGLYRQLFQLLDAQIPRPDLVVYLEARTDVLVRRIRKRDRDFERGITPEYLERLTEAFRSFFHHYTEAPLLVINCSEIDFVEHGGDLADLIREVRGMKQGVQHYIPLGSR